MAYHDKRYPHTISVRLSEKQYSKLCKHNNKGEVIRQLIETL